MSLYAMDTNYIKETLKHNAMVITFIKKDGTERRMLCTCDWTTINQYAEDFEFTAPKGNKRTLPENMIRVWDIEKLAFRCINLNTIISAEIDS